MGRGGAGARVRGDGMRVSAGQHPEHTQLLMGARVALTAIRRLTF